MMPLVRVAPSAPREAASPQPLVLRGRDGLSVDTGQLVREMREVMREKEIDSDRLAAAIELLAQSLRAAPRSYRFEIVRDPITGLAIEILATPT